MENNPNPESSNSVETRAKEHDHYQTIRDATVMRAFLLSEVVLILPLILFLLDLLFNP